MKIEGSNVKITAIVGSYRQGGITESAVDEILSAARDLGAQVEKINLLDRNIQFCTNCRICTQGEGTQRGKCNINDDVREILDRIEASDRFILASPMNFWTVTALMKRFIERLVCYSYWPWGGMGPKYRIQAKDKRAVVVVSCAAPGLIARLSTDCGKLLKKVAQLLGAKKVDMLFLGMVRRNPDVGLDLQARKRAQAIGRRLAAD